MKSCMSMHKKDQTHLIAVIIEADRLRAHLHEVCLCCGICDGLVKGPYLLFMFTPTGYRA
ncbi:hypothetical protein M2277_004562 [Paenibacillus sp. LBL]|nr:hypothetical protein [Paenibacillus sp. LBL]